MAAELAAVVFTGPLQSTDGSKPFVGSFLGTEDLAAQGYEEKEYLASGSAAVYGPARPDATQGPTLGRAEIVPAGAVMRPDLPYTTRVLVRAPKDRSRFSGTVHLEVFHSSGESVHVWPMSRRHMMARGDAWVAVTVSTGAHAGRDGQTRGGVEMMQRVAPQRYARLVLQPGDHKDWPLLRTQNLAQQLQGKDLTDVLQDSSFTGGSGGGGGFGVLVEEIYRSYAHSYDAVTQVAYAIKTGAPGSPLAAWPVRRIYASGVSGTSIYWSAYVDGGHHARARMPDGSPVIDAYMNFVATIPVVRPDDAVFVSVLSEAEVISNIAEGTAEPPDTDAPRFRQYHIPGAGHGISGTGRAEDYASQSTPALQAAGLRPFDPVNFPIIHGIWRHLDRWVQEGVPMPHDEPIERDPKAADGIARDRFGNAKGGVRTPWVDVPNARYFAQSPGNPLAAAYRPFTTQEMKTLYGDGPTYVAQFRARVAQLVKSGWIAASEADLFDPGDANW